MDTSQYLEIFLDESKEHIQSLGDQLMVMEQEPENEDAINEIFRAAHSLKGMAGTMGYKRMQRLTHDMEDVFSEVRNGKMKVDSSLIDVLFQALDALEEYLQNIQETTEEGTNDNDSIINELNRFLKNEGKAKEAPPEKEKPSVSTEKKWKMAGNQIGRIRTSCHDGSCESGESCVRIDCLCTGNMYFESGKSVSCV